ncbi:MAG: adenylate/guanylate cyclase domain-containing protein, partial [Treponema sp.]|nr:adenylate/guanylate cyclase domain-containing protein [Treponema sp.]
MGRHWQGFLIGFFSMLFFAILGLFDIISPLENSFYDLFLKFRPKRERTDLVVFLDVDNKAIAANGVFPWPRSVMADGLLRLKEYGAQAVIFDIEYVDKGPQGVDSVSLRDLPLDFSKTFSEIDGSVWDLINALSANQLRKDEASRVFSDYIDRERENLLEKSLNIARDNDVYLTQASALFGNSWVTLNLRGQPLEGEQASRLKLAEDLFSYPVKNTVNFHNDPVVDILPPLPSFARAARGAGFTRAAIDKDGVRRRIDLVQEFNNFWYLQLAFSFLVNYFNNPGLELEKNRLILRDAEIKSTGEKGDIIIPLDAHGRMLLDWPVTNFEETFTHFSFAYLSGLEQAQTEIEQIVSILSSSKNIYALTSLDPGLTSVPGLLLNVNEKFSSANKERTRAIEENSDKAFNNYLTLRKEAFELLQRFKDLDFASKINALAEDIIKTRPAEAKLIMDETGYLSSLVQNLFAALKNFSVNQDMLHHALAGKVCIVGQTDTTTTDIGVNPFHNEYVSVGSQGVIIDTILSGAFIIWPSPWWSILVSITTPLLILLFTNLAPGFRSLLGFLSAFLIFSILFLIFRFTGIFLTPIYPVFSLISAAIVREIVAYVVSDREKHFIRKAFSTYVSADVVKEIIADPSRLQLGGVKRHMSALFTDLQGFSTISEKLDPEALVSLLNRYLTTMSDIILGEKGTIDKYEGDAIIAFFGAPLELHDHAYRACLSAITMKRAETALNKTLREQNLSPAPLLTRIGINTGIMVAGNMGTENKMNYTIMGNTVNLASRIEGVNKQYGTWILASRETLNETDDRFLTRKLDKVRVMGIVEPVQLYEILETREAATDLQKDTVLFFEKALGLFEKRDWKNAEKAFLYVLDCNPNDNPS